MHTRIDYVLLDSRDMTIDINRGVVLLDIEIGDPEHDAVFLMFGVEISDRDKTDNTRDKTLHMWDKRPHRWDKSEYHRDNSVFG
jgi:hypothetical protein